MLLPPLAMLGAHQGAQEVIRLAKLSGWRAVNLRSRSRADKRPVIDNITSFYFPIGYAAAILLVFAARGARSLTERRGGMIALSYPSRQVRVPKGLSVLEASLRNGVPHASVCGGKARCSTCRIRVVGDRSALPNAIGAGDPSCWRASARAPIPSIRLACQLRPQTDIARLPGLAAE